MARVVVHLDCDCFYAQVELQRLQLPKDAPLCVVQWGMALAVSYGARVYSIKRGDSVDDIRRKAGNHHVHVVSVETIGHDHDAISPPNEKGSSSCDATSGMDIKSREKVSLARYRVASSQVFDVISSKLPSSCPFERASIDEAFLDISAIVHGRSKALCGVNSGEACESHDDLPAFSTDTVVYDGDTHCRGFVQDRYLVEGAKIAAEIRAAVFSATGFTLSGGIASNKMLAKFASSENKPNRQTVVFPSSVPALLSQVPVTRVGGLFCVAKLGMCLS